jgi:hypothetical protein
MLNGYVGIISRTGLCRFQVERHDTLRQTRQAAVLGNKQLRVAFWAVLPDETARQIADLLDQGEGKEALRVLNHSAREAGHLLPLNQ